MKIDIASDLHIHTPNDIHPIFFNNPGDVLVLAGDIAPFCWYDPLIPFFQKVSETWETTLIIPGNHEFYSEQYFQGQINLRNFFRKHFTNIFYIDEGEKVIDDICFIGSILWSDMLHNDAASKEVCKIGINDYNYILWDDDRRITPDDTVNLFQDCVEFIENSLILEKQKKVVMITHHLPSYQSVPKRYKNNLLNGAFASNLEYIMHKYPSIKLWIHGHTHTAFDYMIDNCRVVCNPKGYPHENKGLYKPFRVEV